MKTSKIPGIFLLVILITAVSSFLTFYKIRNIKCISQFHRCTTEIEKKLNNIPAGNIFETAKRIEDSVKGDNRIESYSLHLKLDGSVDVSVMERISRYCVISEKGVYAASKEGIILENEATAGLKCVSISGVSYEIGDTLPEDVIDAVRLWEKLEKFIVAENVVVEGDNLIVEYEGNISLIFPVDRDYNLTAGKAYYIFLRFDKIKEYAADRGVSLSEIDLRFKNPVVRVI